MTPIPLAPLGDFPLRGKERRLVGHLLGSGSDFLGIAQVVVGNGLEAIVELVNQRDAGGDIEIRNLLIRNPIQVLQQRPEAVAVSDH